MKKIFFLIFAFLTFGVDSIFSSERLSLGLGYPYFSLKCHPLELKYATGEGIDVFAGRFYLNFYKKEKVKAFTGIEAGYINFDTLDLKGTGYEGSLFIGGEYFISRKLSLLLDFSPTFINIKSDDDYKEDGIEMVTNFAVYYYFSGKEEKKKSIIQSTSNEKKIISEKTKENKLSETEKKALMKKHFNRATQLYSEGKYKEAIAEWKKVLEIDSAHTLSKQKIEKAKEMKR